MNTLAGGICGGVSGIAGHPCDESFAEAVPISRFSRHPRTNADPGIGSQPPICIGFAREERLSFHRLHHFANLANQKRCFQTGSGRKYSSSSQNRFGTTRTPFNLLQYPYLPADAKCQLLQAGS